jgi:hypothetical protein
MADEVKMNGHWLDCPYWTGELASYGCHCDYDDEDDGPFFVVPTSGYWVETEAPDEA